MINKKNNQKQSYKKSSTLFMQLGLILALFISYSALELKMEYKIPEIAMNVPSDNPDVKDFVYKLEKKQVKPKKVVPKKIEKPVKVQPPVANKVKIVDNTVKVKQPKLASTESNQKTEINPVKVIVPTKKTVKKPTILSSTFVQEMPTFPGCETESSSKDKRACFELKIRKHIQKYFDNDLVQTLGLEEGKQRIKVQFVIDEHGNIIAIKTRAVNKKLEKEATRVIKKLPKMSPGKQNNKPVRVRYNVPINFQVEY